MRTLYDSYAVQRGSIIVERRRDRGVACPSTTSTSSQRVYTDGPLYAPVTGYITRELGAATGIEQALNQVPQRHRRARSSSTRSTRSSPGQDAARVASSSSRSIRGRSRPPATRSATCRARSSRSSRRPGAILAMVSSPTFDPNLLAAHDSASVNANYDALARRPGRPALQPRDRRRPEPARARPSSSSSRRRRSRRASTRPIDVPQPGVATSCPQSTASSATSSGGTCGRGDDGHDRRRAAPLLQHPLRRARRASSATTRSASRPRSSASTTRSSMPLDVDAERSTRAALDDPQTALTGFGQGEVRATPLQMAMVSAGDRERWQS